MICDVMVWGVMGWDGMCVYNVCVCLFLWRVKCSLAHFVCLCCVGTTFVLCVFYVVNVSTNVGD